MSTKLLLVLMLLANWPPVVKELNSHLVRIESIDEDGQASICSGSILNEAAGYALTAAHCIPFGSQDTYWMTANGRDAHLVKMNRLLDLAVISFKIKGETNIVLADETPVAGTEIAIVGYGFGSAAPLTQYGHIAQVKAGARVMIDGMTLPGQSGGPIIDEAGRLVGMSSEMHYMGPSHIGSAVTVETVREFVGELLAGYRDKQAADKRERDERQPYPNRGKHYPPGPRNNPAQLQADKK